MKEKKPRAKKKKEEIKELDTSILIQTEMSEEMEDSYYSYAIEVIGGRAIADVRDGLKPVQRRILYAMNELGLGYNKPFRKSARIVGDVLGKYHPHGDSAVYDAKVRLAQPFKNSYTLVKGQGNFGSIDGDSPAHMRYTEAKLEKIASTLLEELPNDVVDFENNFDDTQKEPVVLPSKIPMLLLNGVSGVAVGMRTEIPPHNLGELIDSYTLYLNKDNVSIDELMDSLKGPDFPTGGIITNIEKFKESFYKTGKGKLILRCNYFFEEIEKGKINIVIDEIPFGLNKQVLVSNIVDLVKDREKDKDKVFDVINEVRDESSREGMRIVIELKKGSNPEIVIKKLISKTKLEESKTYEFLALNENKRPVMYTLDKYFSEVYDFQKQFYRRKYRKILKDLTSQREVVEGFIKADEFIDVIIDFIRNTGDICKTEAEGAKIVKDVLVNGNVEIYEKTKVLKKNLKIAQGFDFTEKQADVILKKTILSLMNLQTEKYKKQLDELNKKIDECERILSDEKEVKKVIKKELRAINKEFSRDRLTKLSDVGRETYDEVLLVEDILYLIDDVNYVKVVDVPRNYDAKDFKDYKLAKIGKNTDCLRVFTNKGRYLKLDLKALGGIVKMKERGNVLSVLLDLDPSEKILLADLHSEVIEKDYVVATKNGYLRYVDGKELDSKNKSVVYTSTKDNDEIVDIKLIEKDVEFDIEITTKPKNKTKIVININDVNKTGKQAKGTYLKELVAAGKELKSFNIKNITQKVVEENIIDVPIQEMLFLDDDVMEIINDNIDNTNSKTNVDTSNETNNIDKLDNEDNSTVE